MKTFQNFMNESRVDTIEEIKDAINGLLVEDLKELLYEFDFIQDPDQHLDMDSLKAPCDLFLDWIDKMNDVELKDIYDTLVDMEVL